MRILFVTAHDERLASSRCRVYQYLPHLAARGIEGEIMPSRPAAAELWRRAGAVDAVFVQKRAPCLAKLLLLRRRAPRLLFDFDDAIWGELSDTLTIFAVIFIVVGLEIANERRAETALAALSRLAEPLALVRRGRQPRQVPREEIVPGDVLLLQAGQQIPADARLVEAYGLQADESSLTGESTPVDKEAEITLPEATPLADRVNMVFAGTSLTRGRGAAIVVATGMMTELGHVAGLAAEVREPRTPLQVTMRELTHWMIWLALGFSAAIPLLGWLMGGQSPKQMLLTGLSLAFATIPEELPILITLVLSLGAYRLSQQRAIVKRLRAAETLSAVTFIATDKTGTLTENRMRVNQLHPEDQAHRILEIGVLCSEVIEGKEEETGDPMEIALLAAAREAGLDVAALRRDYPLRDEFTFDNTRKRMSTVYQRDGGLWIAVKGAPEGLLERASRRWVGESEQPLTESDRQRVLATATEMAEQGLRVLGFAEKSVAVEAARAGTTTRPAGTRLTQGEAESDLTFAGLAGFADPPRPEVKQSISACREAGIRLAMATGDHPLTARAIADQIGLDGAGRLLTGPELDALSDEALRTAAVEVAVYARTTPEQKLRIVQALQERGQVVAVTGDGANDAPALAAAEIGVAMGETGTDVARGAADIVLTDDNFATIVHAVGEGRLLFANLKKAIRYYLSCKVALVSATLLPALLRIPVPFSPVQIILMELFMDLAASATFVAERAESDLMRQPPRDPEEPFMNRAMVTSIFRSAAGLFGAVSVAYLLTWYGGGGLVRAQTMAFVTWLVGHVFLALNLRSEREPLFRMGMLSNRLMVIWAAATVAFVLAVTLIPGARAAFKTVALSGPDWALAAGAALAGSFWLEARKWLLQLREPARSLGSLRG